MPLWQTCGMFGLDSLGRLWISIGAKWIELGPVDRFPPSMFAVPVTKLRDTWTDHVAEVKAELSSYLDSIGA